MNEETCTVKFIGGIDVNFGEKIKELRQQNALSQRQLAEKLDVTQRTVRGWELEGRIPKQACIYESIAALFGCPVDYLLTIEPVVPSSPSPDPEDACSALILQQAKTLFIEHRIPRLEQQEFLLEMEQIYLTSWEDVH